MNEWFYCMSFRALLSMWIKKIVKSSHLEPTRNFFKFFICFLNGEMLTWFRVSFVEMWWCVLISFYCRRCTGRQSTIISMVCMSQSMLSKNQNKSPLDHSISIYIRQNTQSHNWNHSFSFLSFIRWFSVCFGLFTVYRIENHSHINETKRVRAYVYIKIFECDVISLFTVCGTMLLMCYTFWQAIQMLETMRLMPSMCHVNRIAIRKYSDWACWMILKWMQRTFYMQRKNKWIALWIFRRKFFN